MQLEGERMSWSLVSVVSYCGHGGKDQGVEWVKKCLPDDTVVPAT